MPLAMLPAKSLQQWPESSALGNAADFCLATLPMALPPKKICLKLPNSVSNVANQKSTTLPRQDDSGQCRL